MANATLPEHDQETTGDGEFHRAWTDVTELIDLRRRLAAAEIQSDVAAAKRLALVAGAGAVLALTGLSLFVTALAAWLATVTQLGFAAWLAIFAGPLLVVGLLAVVLAVLRFRREFLALEGTRAELREDFEWLRDMLA